ncbi:MAG: hypothetical protein JW786_12045 [Desulfobacterales bacterium]|nr:hypothetical protein [Desulfobacterales bacterium]
MRKDGMLLFINVALGLCLGAGVATFVSQITGCNEQSTVNEIGLETKVIVLIFLFTIYFANILRTFLGFVKFYQDESLYDPDYEKHIGDPGKLYNIRLIDFIAMMFIILCLIFQGMILHLYTVFAWVFFISSVLFVVRNLILTLSFKSNKNASVAAAVDEDEIEQRTDVVTNWLVLDSLFLIPALILILGGNQSESMRNLLFGFSAAILLIISWYDIWRNRTYYFGSTPHAA